MKNQLLRTVDELEWARRKTCAQGPLQPREGADYDAEPSRDHERTHLRGADRCSCGGWARYDAHKTHDGSRWCLLQVATCNDCSKQVALLDSEPITALIRIWNERQQRDACKHSWFRTGEACGLHFRCVHCGEEMGR